MCSSTSVYVIAITRLLSSSTLSIHLRARRGGRTLVLSPHERQKGAVPLLDVGHVRALEVISAIMLEASLYLLHGLWGKGAVSLLDVGHVGALRPAGREEAVGGRALLGRQPPAPGSGGRRAAGEQQQHQAGREHGQLWHAASGGDGRANNPARRRSLQ